MIPRSASVRRKAWVVTFVGMAVAVCHLGPMGQPAQASLDLILQDSPDIFSTGIDIAYDPGTDEFTADGYARKLYDGASTYNITTGPLGRAFELRATINDTGTLQLGGTLRITGKILAKGYTSGLLLSANLTRVGYGAAGDPLEFLFDVIEGDAADLFTSTPFPGGLILHTRAFPGNWTTPFENDYGYGDTGVMTPEPCSLLVWSLLGGAAAGFAWWRRRRRTP